MQGNINFIDALKIAVNGTLNRLPDSPFTEIIEGIDMSYIRYINWFVPLDTCADVMAAWIDCVLIYMVVVLIAKILKQGAEMFIKSLAGFLTLG